MKTLLERVRINKAFPFVGRAAQRSIARTLGFFVTTIVANDIRKSVQGIPVEQGASQNKLDALKEKYGNTVDHRNEEDEASRGAAHEEQMRLEQGFTVTEDPMVVAGKLNIIRLALAADLDVHAQVMRNPLDPNGGTFKNPYDVAPSLEESFARQLSQQPRVNEVMLKAQADALNLNYEDVLRVTKANQEAGTRFLKAHKDEILEKLTLLTARDAEGKEYGIDDAVDVELSLPPIHRARLYVAADRGLWYERDRAINLMMRGHPDGAGNIKLVDGARVEIHKDFEYLMSKDEWKRAITAAVERGATYPALLALVLAKASEKQAVAA